MPDNIPGRRELDTFPYMVRWYNPLLLSKIGLRSIISAIFGQYADQRLIQAATDTVSTNELVSRYDYGDPNAPDPLKRVKTDENGSIWVDYVADVGDGFDSTYAIASLIAADKVQVEGLPEPLPHGDILIFGGDQAYPEATREEYRERFQTPYGLAYNVEFPERKLFAIPGNHDWYDGLAAFDSLFCSSRDRFSEGRGVKIGGWECKQHRSYFAIRLPYNWWIWGADIQFSKYLDDSQVNYFSEISDFLGPEDKIVLCLAQPNWLEADVHGKDELNNLNTIAKIARKKGSHLRVAIAGDWHHYNHYFNDEIDVHLFTAGGGGAFLHPTHKLKDNLKVRLAVREQGAENSAGPEGGKPAVNVKAAEADVGFTEKDYSFMLRKQVSSNGEGDPRNVQKGDPACYPSKLTSRTLTFRNLAFPIYNPRFCIGLGVAYWLITWMFHNIAKIYNISDGRIDEPVGQLMSVLLWMPGYVFYAAVLNPLFAGLLIFMLVCFILYVDSRRGWAKFLIGSAHFMAHMAAMTTFFILFIALNDTLAPKLENVVRHLVEARGGFRGVLGELLFPLQGRVRDLLGILYPFEIIPVGGLVGGIIWGTYYFLTCLLGKMHTNDAFSAIRVKDYKMFLKLRFDPDKLTIYPIGLDSVPDRSEWRVSSHGSNGQHRPHNPVYVAEDGLKPHLIEGPIVIRATNQGG